MKKTITKSLVSTIIAGALVACATSKNESRASASAEASKPLTTISYTAGDAGFRVNSHLIQGEREAILVDAQFTRSETRNVVKMIKDSGRNLKAVFITHGHPDHYLGLEILKKEFPKAKILARPEVIEDIKATAPGKLAYWKPIYKDDLADGFILPKAFNGKELEIEGQKIKLIDLKSGESEHGTALLVESSGKLLTGDAAYSQVHLWLAEERPEGWLDQLEALKALDSVSEVLPGHGPSGDRALLDANEVYIRKFLEVTAKPATQEQAMKALKSAYPDFALPIIAELSVGARIK